MTEGSLDVINEEIDMCDERDIEQVKIVEHKGTIYALEAAIHELSDHSLSSEDIDDEVDTPIQGSFRNS